MARAAEAPARGARSPWRLGPLERRLVLVAVLALLPVSLLSLAGLMEMGRRQRAELLASAQDTMLAVSTAIDAELRVSMAALQALALSPRLAAHDIAGLRTEAATLLAQRPEWANIVLTDATARRQVMNLRLPPGQPFPPLPVDPDGLDTITSTARPRVGDLIYSRLLGGHFLSVQIPVQEHGRVVWVLTAVVKPAAVHDVLRRQRIPPQGLATVIDRNLRIVARTKDHASWVGKSPSPGLRNMLAGTALQGTAESFTLEGKPVYSVFQRLPDSGWSVAVGLPVASIDGPIQRAYGWLAGFVLLSILLGAAAAAALARTIARPMLALAHAAERLGQGHVPPSPASSLPEITAVASAMTQAHAQRETLLSAERRAREVAEQANREKDQFLAMLGHELRNPLAALSSASGLLDVAEARQRPDVAERARAVIRRQVHHLGRLADDLLDAGRAIVGKLALQPEPLDLTVLVRRVLETFDNTGALLHHTVHTELAPVWVHGDATRLEQAVGNLLGNAVKYTPAGGRIEVRLTQHEGHASLDVSDTGIGLEPTLLPRVFDLFVQGEQTLARSEGGLGLGLTLVRRIAELHGGSVQAHSAGPQQGSRFVLQLPALPTPVPPERADPLAAARQHRCNVVLVEDNDDVREGLRTLLELDGHTVHEAADGEAGVALILAVRPDVALIDIGLPKLDGRGVATRVRAEAGQATGLLVALSGYDAAVAAPHGPFDDTLIKPVQHARLAALLEQVAHQAHQPAG